MKTQKVVELFLYIPVEVNEMVITLPRNFNEMNIVQLKLRRLEVHKTDYMFETIRSGKVLRALHILISKPLYKDRSIRINEEDFAQYDPYNMATQVNFIVDPADEHDKTL